MERIKRTMEESIKALRKAPKGVSRKLVKLFHILSDFLREHPDLPERVLPTLLRVQSCIIEGNYAEAFRQLFLLLVLIGTWRKKK
jgi:hypothetical protein